MQYAELLDYVPFIAVTAAFTIAYVRRLYVNTVLYASKGN